MVHNMNAIYETKFSAIRGIQAEHEYYITMIPLRFIPKFFSVTTQAISPKLRSQRKLNKTRIPKITDYILNNLKGYTLSSLTASIDRLLDFVPVNKDISNMGYIRIPKNSKIIINDGQHRIAAITEALKEKPDIGYETISVVLFIDRGLKRNQQMFADLNRYAVKPSPSLSILYDHKDTFGRFIIETAPENFPEIKELAEKNNVFFRKIGNVSNKPEISVTSLKSESFVLNLNKMRELYDSKIPDLMEI